jgi:RNA methyltransferase, TrmH family
MENGAAMVTALGAHSPKLAAVRDLLTKRGRHEQQRFAFEGSTLLEEALEGGVPIEAVYATEAAYESLATRTRCAIACPVYSLGERALQRISDVATPQGIVAVAPFRLEAEEALLESGAPALLLAGLADPGNVGTLLRSAEIFGVRSVLFAEEAVEPYNPKVVRASMGAIFRLRLALLTSESALDLAHSHRYLLVAVDRTGSPLRGFTFPERTIVAVGNERHGFAGQLSGWDAAVGIPQAGGGESLNAAVAGSIVMYELAAQRATLSRGLSTRQKP